MCSAARLGGSRFASASDRVQRSGSTIGSVIVIHHPFRHLGLKLMAVALATLLWLIVAGDHLVERSMRVPLEFRNIPPTLEIVGDPPTAVDVRLRGSSALLGRLEPRDIVAVLDLGIGAAGLADVPPAQRRSARAVRRRGRAGRAGHARARSREVRDGARCRSCRRSTASRRRGS